MKEPISKSDMPQGAPVKKAYQSPNLHVYGHIRDITQGVGNRNTMDNGGVGMGFKSLP